MTLNTAVTHVYHGIEEALLGRRGQYCHASRDHWQ
jgi:hypothetical protein